MDKVEFEHIRVDITLSNSSDPCIIDFYFKDNILVLDSNYGLFCTSVVLFRSKTIKDYIIYKTDEIYKKMSQDCFRPNLLSKSTYETFNRTIIKKSLEILREKIIKEK